jgi:hypothetical protein
VPTADHSFVEKHHAPHHLKSLTQGLISTSRIARSVSHNPHADRLRPMQLPVMTSPRTPTDALSAASTDDIIPMRRAATMGDEADVGRRTATIAEEFVNHGPPILNNQYSPTIRADDREVSFGGGAVPPRPPSTAMETTPVTVPSETILAVGANVRFGLFAPSPGSQSEAEAEVKMNAYILAHGIRRIVVGHQPRGDAPLILCRDGLQVCCISFSDKLFSVVVEGLVTQVISADTSYAVNVEWVGKYEAPELDEADRGTSFTRTLDELASPPPDSTRGCTVFEILISQNPGI